MGGTVERMDEKPTLTVREVAAILKLSRMSVTRLFENEPGVIVIGSPERMHKRKYRSIRIPHHVYERVIGQLTVR